MLYLDVTHKTSSSNNPKTLLQIKITLKMFYIILPANKIRKTFETVKTILPNTDGVTDKDINFKNPLSITRYGVINEFFKLVEYYDTELGSEIDIEKTLDIMKEKFLKFTETRDNKQLIFDAYVIKRIIDCILKNLYKEKEGFMNHFSKDEIILTI